MSGKIAWITGGGSGIGLATAKELAGAGYTCLLSGRNEGALTDAVSAVRALGGQADYAVCDVGDSEAVAGAHETLSARHGPVSLLVNSAGFNIPERSWSTITPSAFEDALSGNLKGSLYTILAVLPAMREAANGLIVNLVSGAGRYVFPGAGPAYTAAKHAVFAMTGTLNMEEAGNGIRACALCPGEVDTPIMDKRPQVPSAEHRARMLAAEDVGKFIRYLAEAPANVNFTEVVMMPTGRSRSDVS